MGLYCGTNLFLLLLLLLLLINQLLWGFNYVKSGNLSPVQFQPYLYKAIWTKFVTEIKRKLKTLQDLKLAVIGDNTVKYDEDEDPDVLGMCALDSEDSED